MRTGSWEGLNAALQDFKLEDSARVISQANQTPKGSLRSPATFERAQLQDTKVSLPDWQGKSHPEAL